MKVSVIMNCLNCIKYLRTAIDSVYSQTHSNWEIILWDNASSQDIENEIYGYDERLRYFRGKETVSLGKARNFAISKAKGDLIAFLDCDDVWLPYKLEKQIECMSDSKIGLVYSNWFVFNDHGYECVKYGRKSPPQGWVFDKVLFSNFTCLSTLIVRSDIVTKEAVVFDPALTYLEDTDFIIQIAKKWHFAYISKPLAKYRMHPASLTAKNEEKFRDEMDLLIEKYSSIWKDFASIHAGAMKRANTKDRAVTFWKGNNRKKARDLLFSHVLSHWSYPIIYLLMFVPYRWVDNVRQLLSKRATGYYAK